MPIHERATCQRCGQRFDVIDRRPFPPHGAFYIATVIDRRDAVRRALVEDLRKHAVECRGEGEK